MEPSGTLRISIQHEVHCPLESGRATLEVLVQGHQEKDKGKIYYLKIYLKIYYWKQSSSKHMEEIVRGGVELRVLFYRSWLHIIIMLILFCFALVWRWKKTASVLSPILVFLESLSLVLVAQQQKQVKSGSREPFLLLPWVAGTRGPWGLVTRAVR